MTRIVFIGPPGAGKGTQAQAIKDHYGIVWVATGEIFRDAIKSGSQMGSEARNYVDSGGLVPDDVVVGIVLERLNQPDCEYGFLLDGFPRTVAQAEALDAADSGHAVDVVIHLQVPHDMLIERVAGRAKSQGRADDSELMVEHRLDVFAHETAPVVAYYAGRGLLETVDGVGPIQTVTKRIISAVDQRIAARAS